VIVGLLLAAGGARRFGSQKLVALLDGVPLVRHAANTLLNTTDAVVAVVGDHAGEVRAVLDDMGIDIVGNPHWASGLSSSLQCGVASLPATADAIVVALGDQPYLDERIVGDVIARWRSTACPIVATRYSGVQGHPVLFDRSVFAELAALRGDVGAKSVIERSPQRTQYVDVAGPAPKDVDTEWDLEELDT
jgi:molybdenum cofactor cytidylyltransferase